jgi:DNA polymerase I - 3''-5'' exonuclease and polymerase domains
MEFKSMEKLFNAFVNKLPDRIHTTTGRIHADFRQFGARSGRMSCTKPNLPQQPSKDIEIKNDKGEVIKKLVWRDVYTARHGYKIVTADYDQMELRILTQASLEPKFIEAFNNGLDLHTMTAELINKEKIDKETPEGNKKRKAAKKVNFGIPYGVTKFGLLYQLQAELIPCTEDEADGMIRGHREAYPVLHEYLDKMDQEARKNLHVRNLAGRLIVYSDPKVTTKKEAERRKAAALKPKKANAKPLMPLDKYRKRLTKQIGNNGKNNPIQSLGVDILKIALKGIYDRLNSGAVDHISGKRQIFLINVVHDEIVLEVPEEMDEYTAQVVKDEMESAGERFLKVVKCPVKPVIADCWKK